MEKSNVLFSSNVNIIKSTSTRKGDQTFLRKITDYYALKKLYEICGRNTNSQFYIFSYDQVKILSPENGIQYIYRKEDAETAEINRIGNAEYGYEKYSPEDLVPLLDEYILHYGKSMWKKSDGFFWERGSFFDQDASDKIGTWKQAAEQLGTVEVTGGGSLFTTYVRQELQKSKSAGKEFISVNEVEFPELDEKDPYYYIYQKTAGVQDEESFKNDNPESKEANAYLQTYTIYSAFEQVEQERIIEGDVTENIFVDAGPGTGKTYTLMQKLNYLVDEAEVEPESIMVLCFTNAAVAEIKKRKNDYIANGSSRGLRNVDVRTFHSFAWWLINMYNSELQDEPGWKEIKMSSLSYDGSISKATHIIRNYTDIVLGGWSHFIVDEIQDLTDVRARLVLELIKGCMQVECGVTVLGDSCQAIYDYNQQDVMMPFSSTKFYKALFTQLYKKGSYFKLAINHRQTNELIELTSQFREAILSEKVGEMKSEVKTLYERMNRLDGRQIAENAGESVFKQLAGDGNVCLLCRNNGQVLKLSASLRKRGIVHIVNAYDHNGCYATWIAKVFYDFDKQMISYDEFEKRFNACNKSTFTNAEETWNRLGRLLKKPDNILLGVDEILEAIYSAQADDPVFHNYEESNIIVSNIHKAKGREYTSVVVEKNFIEGLVRGKNDIGEYKTLYVAVTRPKQKLYSAHLINSDIRMYPIFATGRKRWTKFDSNKTLKYMEVRSNTDTDIESYKLFGDKIQKYIVDKVFPGDEIILRRSKANEILHYDIVHVTDEQQQVIGRTTKMFEEDLEAMTQTDDTCQWPAEIRELYVSDVYTHLTENVASHPEYLMKEKMWSWVDFCGLGRLVYDVY